MIVVAVRVRSAEQYERLRDHPASTAGRFDPECGTGEVLFPGDLAAFRALTDLGLQRVTARFEARP